MTKAKERRVARFAFRQRDLPLLLSLQLLSEMNLARDPADDGSVVFGRARGVLGAWRELGAGATPALAAELARLCRLLDETEPLLSRIARPLTPPG